MGKDYNCSNFGGSDGCSACMDDLRAELEAAVKDGNRLADALVKSREEVLKLRAALLCECPSCFYHKECVEPENMVFVRELRRTTESKVTE